MTNDKAIIRKLIYQAITFVLLIVIALYWLDFSGSVRGIVYAATVEIPIFIIIGLSKIIRTIVYIHGTYNSEIEFAKYSDVASKLPKNHKKIYRLTAIIAVVVCVLLSLWSSVSMLLTVNVLEDDFKDFTIENYTNLDVNTASVALNNTYFASTLPAITITSGPLYDFNENTATKDGEIIGDSQGIAFYTWMKDCPRWAVKKIYNEEVRQIKKSIYVKDGDATLNKINEENIIGYYILKNDGMLIRGKVHSLPKSILNKPEFQTLAQKLKSKFFLENFAHADPDKEDRELEKALKRESELKTLSLRS